MSRLEPWRAEQPEAARPLVSAAAAIRQMVGDRGELGASRVLARWLAAAVAGIIFAVSVALALVGVPDPISRPGDVFANLGRNLVTTVAVGLLAYLWFYFWTSYHATRRLRDMARARPESLFPVPPRVGKARNVFGRKDVIDEIAKNLTGDFRTGPQLIVGDTGSGKTSLLLALADHFAHQDKHPIVLSLRNAEEIDFSEMAEERFKEYIDPYVRTTGDADRLWRLVCRRGDIIVLADDLDRAKGMAADPYKTAARIALEAARQRGLPLVVTSRAEGLPPNADIAPIKLGPLEMDIEEAVCKVFKRAGMRADDGDESKTVRENIDKGKLTENPFYLGVLAEVLRLHYLVTPNDGDELAVRVALLQAWRNGLVGKNTFPEDEWRQREAVLARIADFAAARLTPEIESTKAEPESAEGEWLKDLHAAERFDLVELDEDGRHRFKHDVMHAYFASRVLPDNGTSGLRSRLRRRRSRALLLGALDRAPDAPRVQLALIFAAAATHDRGLCRHICKRLLTKSPHGTDERALLRATVAAKVARAGEFHDVDQRIAATCDAARRVAPPLIRRTALEELTKLRGKQAIKTLWAFAGDDDYDVRWAAAEKLVARCSADGRTQTGGDSGSFLAGADAYAVLNLKDNLEAAERLTKPADDRSPEIMALKHMAWILPALRTRARASGDSRLEGLVAAHLHALLILEKEGAGGKGVSSELGLEASIAQGFKVDAQLNPGSGEYQDARKMLSRAKFWYSQLNLLHAITVRVANEAELPAGKKLVTDLLPEDRHPFVKAAGALCNRAIDEAAQNEEPATVKRYVWADEGELVAHRPAELDEGRDNSSRRTGMLDEVIQLVGDIVVLLNMNEKGDAEQRQKFATKNRLPYCMQQSRDRSELFNECHSKCEFRLCPYQPAINQRSAHRELSRAFCSHQRFHATEAVAKHWGSKVKQHNLRDFWRQLELSARM